MDSYRLVTRAASERLIAVRRCFWKFSDCPIAIATAVAVLSAALGNVFFRRQHRGRTRQSNSVTSSVEENWLQRIKKWRLMKFWLIVMERMLSLVEFAVAPTIPDVGLPSTVHPIYTTQSPPSSDVVCKEGRDRLPFNDELKKICFRSNSSYGVYKTPKSCAGEIQQGFCWTPVSAASENVFEHSSCIFLMDDLSLSTNSTPVRDVRRKMAYKIRSWRALIRNLEGTPHLPHKSSANSSSIGWTGFIWYWLTSWFSSDSPLQLKGESSKRKRKRLDCYDDDLGLYIPHLKGQSRQYQLGPVPKIGGLSAIPVIGNWYSPVVVRPSQERSNLEQNDPVSDDEQETYEIIGEEK